MNKKTMLKTEAIDLTAKVQTNKLVKFGPLYIGGSLSKESFEQLKKLGIETLINIRTIDETPIDEEQNAINAGLAYFNVPVEGCHVLNEDKVHAVNNLIDYRDGKTLVYCASGNRASAWLAFHLKDNYQFTSEEAIETVTKVAMTKSELIQETLKELKRRSK